jgi:AraC-like DNA-binding protein
MYRTQLDQSPWTKPSRDREVSLFDLEPGTYELRIQSTDRYGRWVNNICIVTIIVEPHWYETWWAMLVGILLIIAFFVIVGQTLWYIRKLKRQRHEVLENYLALLDQKNRPQQSTENVVAHSGNIKPEDQWFLDKIRRYIEENISNNAANIDEMAAEAATSRSTLNRRLNSIIGITAAQLLIDARMQYAIRLITDERKEKNNISVADIAFKCGYTDPKYFSRCFKQKYGVAPSDYTTKE